MPSPGESSASLTRREDPRQPLGFRTLVNTHHAAPNAGVILFTGASDKTWIGGRLPFSLSIVGAPGGTLFVSIETSVALRTNRAGVATVKATIPNIPGLIGGTAFQQCMVIDPGANGFGAALGNAVKIVVGG